MPFVSTFGQGWNFGSQIGAAYTGRDAAKNASEHQAIMAQRIQQLLSGRTEEIARGVEAGGEQAGAAVDRATQNAMAGLDWGGMSAYGKVGISKDEANALLQQIYGESMGALDPYRETGGVALSQIKEGLAPGGEFNKQFGPGDLQLDPGYQFRLEEGAKALERSAAARGGALAGGTLKSLSRYSQGVASDEYGKAFERFRAGQADRFSRLSTVAGTGLRATETGAQLSENYAGRASANITRAGESQGNILYGTQRDMGDLAFRGATTAGGFRMSGQNNAAGLRFRGLAGVTDAMESEANARAAGIVGASNAFLKGITGAGNALSSFKNPFEYAGERTEENPNGTKSGRPWWWG